MISEIGTQGQTAIDIVDVKERIKLDELRDELKDIIYSYISNPIEKNKDYLKTNRTLEELKSNPFTEDSLGASNVLKSIESYLACRQTEPTTLENETAIEIENLFNKGINGIQYQSLISGILNEASLRHQKTFFHEICSKYNLGILNFFIEFVKDINYPDPNFGWTPLMIALTRLQSVEFIEKLIENGADVNNTNKRNYLSPLQLSILLEVAYTKSDENTTNIRNHFKNIRQCLQKHGARIILEDFLKALNSSKTNDFMTKLEIEEDQINRFDEEVKRLAAQELIDTCNDPDNQENFFNLLCRLEEGDKNSAEIVNYPLNIEFISEFTSEQKGVPISRTPFSVACTHFVSMVNDTRCGQEDINNFFSKALIKLIECGGEFDESSIAYKAFALWNKKTLNTLESHRENLLRYNNYYKKLGQNPE